MSTVSSTKEIKSMFHLVMAQRNPFETDVFFQSDEFPIVLEPSENFISKQYCKVRIKNNTSMASATQKIKTRE